VKQLECDLTTHLHYPYFFTKRWFIKQKYNVRLSLQKTGKVLSSVKYNTFLNCRQTSAFCKALYSFKEFPKFIVFQLQMTRYPTTNCSLQDRNNFKVWRGR
jgi:hypothetical protein